MFLFKTKSIIFMSIVLCLSCLGEEGKDVFDIDSVVAVWQKGLQEHCADWREAVVGVEPKITPSGVVYERHHIVPGRPNESFAILDASGLPFTEPHYHPAGHWRIFFVLQGGALVIVGDREHQVGVGDVLVIPPEMAHYVIPDDECVIGMVNTPSYTANPDEYIPLTSSNEAVGFDYEQFEQLTQSAH